MSNHPENNKNENEELSFAELMDSYDTETNEDLRVGDKIIGDIISIGKDVVFVDIGSKIDGVVEKTEFLDDGENESFQVGDTLELYVISIDESKIELSRGRSGVGGLMHMEAAVKDALPVEGTVQDQCKGGFNVNVLGKRAFCPISQMDISYIENPEDYIGNTYMFLITQFEENGRNIVVSRRDLLSKAAAEAGRRFYEEVAVGTILEGRVTRITSYGAFVELVPHLEGMVHISEISWSKTIKPDEILKIGDNVRVKVLDIEKKDMSDKLKISLSIKQTTDHPWDSIAGRFNQGEKVKGTITRCMDFGAFTEIAPGIEGLIHISEMSYTQRILKPEDVVREGESVYVMIKDVDIEKKRISLSLRDAVGDPWLDVEETYQVGQLIEGTIEKKERFGIFIQLKPGITGLLPKSKIADALNPGQIEKLREGDAVTVLIEKIDVKERKILLGPGDTESATDWQHYAKDTGSDLSQLGEKLREALKSKK